MLAIAQAFVRRFLGHRAGATAVIFAIMAPVLAVLSVATVDLYRAAAMKQQLQESLDAAALAVARSRVKSDEEAQKLGNVTYRAQLNRHKLASTGATFKLGVDNTVIASAGGQLSPFILGVFGKDQLLTNVETEVKRAQGTPIELVLVLDTTESMKDQPLADLKVSAKFLVKQLHDTAAPGFLEIGVVPFARYVNIGVSRRYEPWVKVAADYSINHPAPDPPVCTEQKKSVNCKTVYRDCVKDGVMRKNGCSTTTCDQQSYSPPRIKCQEAWVEHFKFNGCVGSPPHPRNVNDTAGTVYPGYLRVGCGKEITPLTTSKATVDNAIDALVATDNTYIPAGLAWGFNMLSKTQPLTEADDYDKTGDNLQPRKVLVLMTDGANTVLMNHGNGRHDKSPSGTSPAKEANDYTSQLCTNIKAQNIEVFTIAFLIDDIKAKELVENCATDGDHYFDASDAAKLHAAFGSIADSLRNLYISR